MYWLDLGQSHEAASDLGKVEKKNALNKDFNSYTSVL